MGVVVLLVVLFAVLGTAAAVGVSAMVAGRVMVFRDREWELD